MAKNRIGENVFSTMLNKKCRMAYPSQLKALRASRVEVPLFARLKSRTKGRQVRQTGRRKLARAQTQFPPQHIQKTMRRMWI